MNKDFSLRSIVCKKILSFTEYYAHKKAKTLCRGKVYEPKIPQKLLRK
ncbi:hypothetical protein [Butyrivibrio fibrisolvens]|nr:hypothetical protein [Butyrivibrio fibrisolvens]